MTDDLVKRLNEDFSSSAREDIQYQMKVYEKERKEAADRIEKLEAALRNVTTAWDMWQKTSNSNSFTELFARICEAKALEEKDER